MGFFVLSLWERTKSGRVHDVRLGKYSITYEDAGPEALGKLEDWLRKEI